MKTLLSLILITFFVMNVPGFATEGQDKVIVTLDGTEIVFPDAQPFIDVRDRTLVPIRFVSEAIGSDVSWDDRTQTVTIVRDKITITYTIGSFKATLNGNIMVFDSFGILKEDRTFVPLRFIAELLNCGVEWVEETNTVVITSPPEVEEFPEPKISVHFQEGEYDGRLLWITLDNVRDYVSCPNFEFKVDFVTPKEFNVIEQDEGAILGWQEYSLNQFGKVYITEPTIVSVSRKYYTTRENMKSFKLYDNMPLEFVLTVRRNCSGEEREYRYLESFRYSYPAK